MGATPLFLFLLLAPADDVPELIRRMRISSDAAIRYRLESILTRIVRPRHLPLLLKEVEAGPAAIRPHLIRPLRAIGGAQALAALRGLLRKFDWPSRGEAAYAMKILGDGSGLRYLVEEFPKPGMKKEDLLVLTRFLTVYYSDSKETVQALARVLAREKDEELRGRLVDTLGTHKDVQATAILRKISTDQADPVRFEAVAALLRGRDGDALRIALAALEKGEIPIRALYQVLSAIQIARPPGTAERLRAILEKGADSQTRSQIIRTLAAWKDRKSLPLLQKLSEDPDAAVALAARDALLEMADRSQIEALRKLLNHAQPHTRLQAAQALLGLDDLTALEAVRKELANPSWGYRRRAVDLLRDCRRKETVDLLLGALDDDHPQVRSAAVSALVQTLSALFPYLRFDLARIGYDPASDDKERRRTAIGKITAWWSKNRKRSR